MHTYIFGVSSNDCVQTTRSVFSLTTVHPLIEERRSNFINRNKLQSV